MKALIMVHLPTLPDHGVLFDRRATAPCNVRACKESLNILAFSTAITFDARACHSSSARGLPQRVIFAPVQLRGPSMLGYLMKLLRACDLV